MSRNTGGTLDPVTCVHDTAWIAELMGDPKLKVCPRSECRCAERPIWSSTTSSAKLSREEPDAGNLRVRICGGRGGQRPRLPGNLAGDAKGKGASGSNREAESTDAPERGGLPRSSDEAG
jgi:hypothetical protein